MVQLAEGVPARVGQGAGRFTVYTDGACVHNPGGPGGWAAIVTSGESTNELVGGVRSTTNNRMELVAAINGLEATPEGSEVVLISDSEYMVKAFTEHRIERWANCAWRSGGGQRRPNYDLWLRLYRAVRARRVAFRWVRGHAGDPYNERCDRLAGRAAYGLDLPIDQGYITQRHVPRVEGQRSLFGPHGEDV